MSDPTLSRLGRDFHQLLSREQIAERVMTLGKEITTHYKNCGGDLVLLAVLKGSVLFLADLCRAIELPCHLDFIGIASYGDETESSGVVKITSDVSKPIEGKHVLVVEDIIDTGLTAEYLLNNLRTRKPASVGLCSLLHKPDRTRRAIKIDYLGFSVPDKFVVGYGLDAAQKYRNLDFIGYINP
jgi:hypoxanthine phosphoribosyltransferase